MFCHTKGGVSSTESLNNHLKSKHRLHGSEDYSSTGRDPITNFDEGNESL